MRAPLAVLAGVVVAVIAGAVLGEYGFDGLAVIGSGLMTGLFVAEGVLAVGKGGSRLFAGASAVLAAGALAWAGWIATGHRLGTATWEGWLAIALAALAGGFRARPTAPARDSRPGPEATE